MDTFEKLQEKMAKFVTDRDWDKYHNPKNLAMSIAIEAAELMEIFQWKSIEEANEAALEDKNIREELEDEVADIIIYCLSLANVTKIDLKAVIERKMERNNSRFPIGQSLG